MGKRNVQLNGDKNAIFYVYLPGHPGKEVLGAVGSSIGLIELFGEIGRSDLAMMLSGVDVILDCSKDKKLIGIEILT